MRWSLFLFAFIVLVGAAGFGWRAYGAAAAEKPVASGPRPVAVVLATVGQRDMPIWLTGIGAVQASSTVTIRPRVGGVLDEVAFSEGALVTAGDVLARIDPRPYRATLAQASAKKAQDEAQVANAKRELERIRELVASEAESQRTLDQQESTLAQLMAQVAADQAALDAAQLDLDFTTVRSPITGRTGVRQVDAGNVVTANQAAGLVVVTSLQPIDVLFTLPQQMLGALRQRGEAAPLAVQALNDDGTVLAKGRLTLIDNQIDSATGTLRLKATFPNTDQALWPGQFVAARVLVDTRRQALVVPTEVVQAGINGPFVYVVKADSTVEVRAVKVGPVVTGQTVIEDGLHDGEQVVRDGQSRLKPGSTVAAQSAEPSADEPAKATHSGEKHKNHPAQGEPR